jgi:hypothetical protein
MNEPRSGTLPWRASSYSGSNANCVECASWAWHTSTYSGSTVHCVETASASWHTSSYSGSHTNCLQTVTLPTTVAVRDSKHPDHDHVTFSAPAWGAFLGAVRSGEL